MKYGYLLFKGAFYHMKHLCWKHMQLNTHTTLSIFSLHTRILFVILRARVIFSRINLSVGLRSSNDYCHSCRIIHKSLQNNIEWTGVEFKQRHGVLNETCTRLRNLTFIARTVMYEFWQSRFMSFSSGLEGHATMFFYGTTRFPWTKSIQNILGLLNQP